MSHDTVVSHSISRASLRLPPSPGRFSRMRFRRIKRLAVAALAVLVVALGTKAGMEGGKIRIHSPLINLSKAQIIKKGLESGVDFSLTSSCYDPSSEGKACGRCDACLLRLKGFAEAGIKDPGKYRT